MAKQQKPARPQTQPTQAKKPTPKPAAKPGTGAVREVLPTDHLWWFGILAAIFGFLLYVNTFGHLYALDDYSCLKDNYIVQGGLKNIGTIFTTEYRYGYKAWGSVGSLYRPATLTMFAAEWGIAPDNPTFYHLMNAFWYAMTGWLLWATWRRVLKGHPAVMTALAVLFFMAHPVHTEVVANIKSRDEIMAVFFCTAALFAIWKYFERDSKAWLAAAVAFFGTAFFFKESTITFLAIFPLCIWFFTDKPAGENLKITGLMLIPTAIFLLARKNALASQPFEEVTSVLDNFIVEAKDSASRLASAFMMCFRYVQTLVFPHPLVSDLGYSTYKPVNFGDWRALLGFVSHVGMFVWALMNLRRKHFLSFAILFYLITFSLYSNILLLIGTSYGERLLYLPSLGFAFALAWAIVKLLKINELGEVWNPDGKMALVWGIGGVLIALYGFKTISRNTVWYDSATLYAADIPNSPNSAKLNYHHALEHAKLGIDEDAGRVVDSAEVRRAIDFYSHAIEIHPPYHDAFGSRGLAWFRLGDFDKAMADYQNCLKYRPNDSKVLSNMGFLYMMQGHKLYNPAEAEKIYRRAVEADPRFVDARRNLGSVMAMQGRFADAIKQWEEALKIEPDNVTLLTFIGAAYTDLGQPEKGKIWFEKAEVAKRLPAPKK